jgi:predicted O-methyltransferase YrrM
MLPHSSYIKNDYGSLFSAIVRLREPSHLVELGVLNGYSTLHIAKALKENHKATGIKSVLAAYDLWEGYLFKRGDIEEVSNMLKEEGVVEYVLLLKGDAFEVYDNLPNGYVDFLHVDISNDGDKLRRIMELWNPKIAPKGTILLEGGSEERDKVDWMLKYNKAPIKPELESNEIIQNEYRYITYTKFPSVTRMTKLC